jgi:hypothetical protein
MRTYWRSGGIAPHILDLGTGWRCVVSFTPRPLYPKGRVFHNVKKKGVDMDWTEMAHAIILLL